MHAEPYSFVLVVSAALSIPLGLALRTLLRLEERVIVPILRVASSSGERTALPLKRIQVLTRPIEDIDLVMCWCL